MALFENFPYTNLHELNLDWLINELNRIKDSAVISVNGMTGDVVLYENATVQFPNVPEDHWSIIRMANGTDRGIMFGNDNKAYIVHGNLMAEIYAQNNQPPYPVTSVNGQTGDITLFTDNNSVVAFPAIDDPNIAGWIMGRSINNTPCYIQLNDDGTMGLTAGVNSYRIYTTNDTANDIINVPTDANTDIWGLIRTTSEGSVGIMFSNDDQLTTPEAYIRYVDSMDVVHTEKLLTSADIPSASGVVSFNGQTGVVVVKGSDLIISTTDTRTIAQGFADVATTDYAIKGSVAYVENTNTATQNIPFGAYVIWQNAPYISSQAISIGDTLSGTNLTAISTGGISNDLRADVDTLNGNKVNKSDNGYFNSWLANNGAYATYNTKPYDIVVCHNGSRNYIFVVEAGNYSTWSVHGSSMTETSLTISVASDGKTTITNNAPVGLNITVYRLNAMY